MAAHRKPPASGSRVAKRNVVVAINYGRPRSHLGAFFTAVTDELVERGWRRKDKPIGSYHVLLGESIGRGIPFDRLRSAAASAVVSCARGPGPLVNFTKHFKQLTWKVDMVECLREFCRRNAIDLWSIIPETYLFYGGDVERSERREFLDAYARHTEAGSRNVWIVKPSGGGKGGRIVCLDNLRDIGDHLSSVLNKPGSDWVVQKYMENPMLLVGERKFDMRCWVLVTPDYKVYLYRQGVLRTGSVKFTLDSLSDSFVHLSNHCIQVKHPSYGKYEPTNEMWYEQFEKYIETLFPDGSVQFERDIVGQIRALVLMSMDASRGFLFQPPDLGYHSSHMFGFDFMVDDVGKVWLIEINSSPAAAEAIQPRLVSDVIDVGILPWVDQTDSVSATTKGRGATGAPIRTVHRSRGGASLADSDESEEDTDRKTAAARTDAAVARGVGRHPLSVRRRAHSEPRAPRSGRAGVGEEKGSDEADKVASAPAAGGGGGGGTATDSDLSTPYVHQWGFECLSDMDIDLSAFKLKR